MCKNTIFLEVGAILFLIKMLLFNETSYKFVRTSILAQILAKFIAWL